MVAEPMTAEPMADEPMTGLPRRRPRVAVRALATLVALVLALGLGELALRLFAKPPRVLGQMYFRDSTGAPVGAPGDVGGALAKALARGLVVMLEPDQTPPGRPRGRFAPGHFSICYTDNDVLQRDWLDARGCVDVQINRYGLRERDDIRPDNKAADEHRIVCVGDSFTFGWGVPVELCWVRLLEQELRKTQGHVHTVNCGASGALCVDEYAVGLRTRFGLFLPDVVLVTICLNDLIPSAGLFFAPAPKPSGLMLWDRLRTLGARSPLDLDPSIDWVGLLLGVGEKEGTEAGLYGADKPFAAMWSQGTPQRALADMRDWCGAHKARLMVAIWPFLQGLGPGRIYPFAKLHRMVGEECSRLGIPFLDLLPVLQPLPAEDLWVTPADMHPNPKAQRAVVPALTEFVRRAR
jgi:lysophospholipase L1-like esterase